MLWTDLTFGVEIECYIPLRGVNLSDALSRAGVPMSVVTGSIHRTTTGWKAVTDASLAAPPTGMRGVEVVSPILTGEEGIATVRIVAEVIKAAGGIVNKSCGLHVHIGAAAMSVDQLKNLAKMFVQYEHHFDVVCPMSRRANRFAQSNRAIAGASGRGSRPSEIAAACTRIDSLRTLRSVAECMNGGYDGGRNHYNAHRYYKLNFQSLAVHGTVEYRQQAGSVEAAKIACWIKACAQFSASAFTVRTVASADEPTWLKFVRKFDRHVQEYLNDRRARLNRTPAAAAAPAEDLSEIPF